MADSNVNRDTSISQGFGFVGGTVSQTRSRHGMSITAALGNPIGSTPIVNLNQGSKTDTTPRQKETSVRFQHNSYARYPVGGAVQQNPGSDHSNARLIAPYLFRWSLPPEPFLDRPNHREQATTRGLAGHSSLIGFPKNGVQTSASQFLGDAVQQYRPFGYRDCVAQIDSDHHSETLQQEHPFHLPRYEAQRATPYPIGGAVQQAPSDGPSDGLPSSPPVASVHSSPQIQEAATGYGNSIKGIEGDCHKETKSPDLPPHKNNKDANVEASGLYSSYKRQKTPVWEWNEPSSDRTVRVLSSSPRKSPGRKSRSSSPVRRQIQRELDLASQHDVAQVNTLPTQSRLQQHYQMLRSPTRKEPRPPIHQKIPPPSFAVSEAPSSPGERISLVTPALRPRDEHLAEQFLDLEIYKDDNVYDLFASVENPEASTAKIGPKIHTWRPFPEISAEEHGRRVQWYGGREFWTKPSHSTTALNGANEIANPLRPCIQCHVLFYENAFQRQRSFRPRSKKRPLAVALRVKPRRHILVEDTDWQIGRDWEDLENRSEPVDDGIAEIMDLKKLFPEVSAYV